ncbi:MAG: T9SS type A sorting domain-containing protein [Saprospiraceae bacterium]|nr:T9SS type A sorting domain-containing protein [Saprospiraceae bacterium]
MVRTYTASLIFIFLATTSQDLIGETYYFKGFSWPGSDRDWIDGRHPFPNASPTDTVVFDHGWPNEVSGDIDFIGTLIVRKWGTFYDRVHAAGLEVHSCVIFLRQLRVHHFSNYLMGSFWDDCIVEYFSSSPNAETTFYKENELLVSFKMTNAGKINCVDCHRLTLRGFGSDSHLNHGTIEAPILLETNATFTNYGIITNDITLQSGSTFINENTLDSDLDLHVQSGATFINHSTIGPNVNLRIDPGATVINHGTLNTNFHMSEGATVTNHGTITEWAFLENHASLTNHGTLESDVNVPPLATLTNNGEVDGTVYLLGTMRGTGTINRMDASRDSKIHPGNSIGTVEILSSISNGGMILEMEVDGANGSSDLLDVTSTNGQMGVVYLDVSFLSPPSIGDRYLLIDGVTSIGVLPTVPPSSTQRYDIFHDAESDQLVLQVSSLLPVELVSFSATALHDQVALQWQTASEIDNHGFYIQRSGEGTREWADITFVESQGTGDQMQDYFYTDEQPLAERSYYRLRQVDFDGREDFSPIVEVRLAAAPTPRIYPNLLETGAQYLHVEGAAGSNLILANLQGQVVLRHKLSGDLSHLQMTGYPPGIYVIVIETKGVRHVERVVVK